MAKRKAVRKDEERLLARADELLADLVEIGRDIEENEKEYAEEVERLARERRELFAGAQERKSTAEAELAVLMRSNRDVFFADGDVCPLTYGALLHAVESRVVIHGKKGEVIALAEAAGLTDAVKIEKSLDRDAIGKWPAEQLAVIGAERKCKDVFSFDLKKKEGSRG